MGNRSLAQEWATAVVDRSSEGFFKDSPPQNAGWWMAVGNPYDFPRKMI